METLAHHSKDWRLALDKSTALIDVNQIDQTMAQGPEVLNEQVDAFMRYKTTLIEQFHDHVASSMPTNYISMSDEERRIAEGPPLE